MDKVHDGGVWSAELGAAPGTYRLEVCYLSGTVVVVDDPYRFEPTLGEVDLTCWARASTAGSGRCSALIP